MINSNYNGILVIRAKNALFNAGFDGNPRQLPDGTIYATDKALKYCIREYLATFRNQKVFVRRDRHINKKGDLVYSTLKENFENKTNLQLNNATQSDIINKLKDFIDVRLFGIVFSPKSKGGDKKNVSMTGPVQISYGINKYNKSMPYNNDILSPYVVDKTKATQTTIGNEMKTDEVYYVYDISVNKNNASGDLGTGMTEDDLKLLKESLMNGVDIITSTTKYSVESVLLIWFKNPNNKIFNNLSDFVIVYDNENGSKIIDISKLKEYLSNEGVSDIEITSKESKIEIKEE